MAYDGMDIDGIRQTTASLLSDIKNDLLSSLDDLQSDSKRGVFYSDYLSRYTHEIANITISEYNTATSLINKIEFTPLEARELYSESDTPSTTHVYESINLDNIEGTILSFLSSAGNESFKNINSAMISSNEITSLESAASENQTSQFNRLRLFLDRYETPNTDANLEWLTENFNSNIQDMKRKLYLELFQQAQENFSWITSNISEIEDLHSSFTSSYNALIGDMVTANIAAYKADIMGNISAYELELKKINAELEVRELEIDLDTSRQEMIVEQYVSRMEAYVKMYAKKSAINIEMLNSRIAGGTATSNGYAKLLATYARNFSAVAMGRQ